MVFYKCRHGADLHCIGIICRVLKESIVRVEELLRQKEEELSRRTTVIQAAKEAQVRKLNLCLEVEGQSLIQIPVSSFTIGG
jgi:uncharacterized membrane protein YqiK